MSEKNIDKNHHLKNLLINSTIAGKPLPPDLRNSLVEIFQRREEKLDKSWQKKLVKLASLGLFVMIVVGGIVDVNFGFTGVSYVSSPFASEEGFRHPDELVRAPDFSMDKVEIEKYVSDSRGTVEGVLEGRVALENLRYLQAVPQINAKGGIRLVTALPIEFEGVGVYHQTFADYTAQIPQSLEEIIAVSEGTPDDNKKPWIEIIGSILYRKIVYGISSGRSDVAEQIIDMMCGGSGTSLISSDLEGLFVDGYGYPEVINAFNEGILPDEITLQTEENSQTKENRFRNKALSLLLGRKLYEQQGHDSVMKFYLQNLDLGNLEGARIIGVGPAAEIFFGKPVDRLSLAEQYILAALIPQAQSVINQCSDEAACTDIYERADGIKEQAFAKVNLMLARGKITETEANDIKQELENYQFRMPTAPSKYRADWIKNLSEINRQRVFTVAHAPLGVLSKYATPTEKGWTISPEQMEGIIRELQTMNVGPERPYNNELNDFINADMLRVNSGYLNRNIYNLVISGEEAFYPETMGNVPGLNIAVIKGGEPIAVYDRSGESFKPFVPGSMIKPFIYAFLISEGVWDLGDMVDDTSGNYGLDGSFVRNATYDMGMMTVEQSLVNSRNVPVQRALKELIHRDPNAWSKLQNFLKKFGIFISNQKGVEVSNPFDPDNPSVLPAEGTGVGAFISTNDEIITPIEAFGRAMIEFTDADGGQFTSTEKNAMQKVSGIISNEGYSSNLNNGPTVWGPREKAMLTMNGFNVKRSYIKTGTVLGIDGSTTGCTTVVVLEGQDGNKVAVTVNINSIDENGNYVSTGRYNQESSQNALPTAIAVALETLKWGQTSYQELTDINVPVIAAKFQAQWES